MALPAFGSARTRALDNAGEFLVKSPILMFPDLSWSKKNEYECTFKFRKKMVNYWSR